MRRLTYDFAADVSRLTLLDVHNLWARMPALLVARGVLVRKPDVRA